MVTRIRESIEELNREERGTHDSASRFAPVGNEKATPRPQKLEHCDKSFSLIQRHEVVENEAGDDAIESGRLEGWCHRGPFHERNSLLHTSVLCFLARHREDFGIAVECEHARERIRTCDLSRESPRAATDINDAHAFSTTTALKIQAIDDHRFELRILQRESDERIIEACEDPKPKRGNVLLAVHQNQSPGARLPATPST
jgi:hypothetical protein